MNSRPGSVPNTVWGICAAAFLCAAPGVSAQTVNKQVEAAERTLFTDRPDTRPSTRTAGISALEVAQALASNSAISTPHPAIIDANEAARNFRQAQLQRKHGVRLLPEEWAQSADAIVMNDRYWLRQGNLQQLAELAQRSSSDTRR